MSDTNATTLPEAVMFPVLRVENPQKHAKPPVPLLSLWERPVNSSDIFEEDMNCVVSRQAVYDTPISITYINDVILDDTLGDGLHPV